MGVGRLDNFLVGKYSVVALIFLVSFKPMGQHVVHPEWLHALIRRFFLVLNSLQLKYLNMNIFNLLALLLKSAEVR